FIEADGVREGEAVEIFADLSNELTIGTEFEELRGARPVDRAPFARSGKHEDMPLGVHRDTGDLAQIDIGREFQKIDVPLELDLGNALLSPRHGGSAKREPYDDRPASHGNSF